MSLKRHNLLKVYCSTTLNSKHKRFPSSPTFRNLNSIQLLSSKYLSLLSPVTSPSRQSITRSLMTSSLSPERKLEIRQKTQDIINDNTVAVFSKSSCPFCDKTKALLKEVNANFCVIELDQIHDGPAIQEVLKEISGQSTVPNIYIENKHIGGNAELQAMKAQLPELLREVGALYDDQ